ncbi:hypothetical protein SAMN05216436_102147 [bacterium A37T11]|nr:hypothetical protein SAMN05216436_102147 [bacterium A37T11]
MNRFVISGFKRFNDHQFSTIAGTVTLAMTNNIYFTDPVPAITVVQTALDDYRLKLELASRKGSPYDTEEKNASRVVLEELLKQVAFYVNITAKGQVNLLLSSGLPLNELPSSLKEPGTPVNIRLSDGRLSGQIKLDFKAVKDAWEYEYQVSHELDENKAPIWADPVSTTTSRGNIIVPVIPGLVYRVRVRARNGRGLGDWSEPVQIIAR